MIINITVFIVGTPSFTGYMEFEVKFKQWECWP